MWKPSCTHETDQCTRFIFHEIPYIIRHAPTIYRIACQRCTFLRIAIAILSLYTDAMRVSSSADSVLTFFSFTSHACFLAIPVHAVLVKVGPNHQLSNLSKHNHEKHNVHLAISMHNPGFCSQRDAVMDLWDPQAVWDTPEVILKATTALRRVWHGLGQESHATA